MRKIIPWLRNVELLAAKAYQAAADRLFDDQKFSSFLSRMSEEERWHYHIIGSAAQYLYENDIHPESAILIDAEIKDEIETPFHELTGLLADKKPSRQDVVDCIIRTEFSELNFAFSYVVKTLSEISFEFQHVAGTIEGHKERIIEFLEDLPGDLVVSEDIYKLPKLWDKKILIVDDDPSMRKALSYALQCLGKVESAADGQGGLEKIKKSFYNVIISDINMPKLNGIEFYKKAVEINPHIYRCFLFLSGDMTPDARNFLKTNHLLWFEKPFSLRKLLRTGQEIIDKTV